MHEYLETAKKTLLTATRKVVKKSSEVYDVTKLSLKISSLEDEADKKYNEIGKLIYSNFKGFEISSEDVERLCAEIDVIKGNIDDISRQISELKNATICPECGAEVSKNSTFCAKCGEKI